MNRGKNYTFWQLYSERNIRIPKIQRDYIQGRENAKIKTKKENFIDNLIVNALINEKETNLNFVYGFFEENYFVPIDGQQRLTTLFLLHLFIYKNIYDEDFQCKLKYETRTYTQQFIEGICRFESKYFKNFNIEISKAIKNSFFYSSIWDNDPSIVSCLSVLDCIQKKFKEQTKIDKADFEVYYTKLIDKFNCTITFSLLDIGINRIGKPNQLYIRMNSRGRQLTDFENMKSSIYDFIENKNNQYDVIELQQWKKENRKNIDGDWLELLWNFFEPPENAKKYVDFLYKELFHCIIINNLYINNKDKIKDWMAEEENADKNVNSIFFETYLKLAEYRPIIFLKDISNFFNVLNTIKEFDIYEDVCSDIFEFEKRFSTKLKEYKTKILVYSITKFGESSNRNINPDKFSEWYRIIRNLTRNTEINTEDNFIDMINDINKFKYVNDIMRHLNNLEKNFKHFDKQQCYEEEFKGKIINKYNKWKDTIIEAEKYEKLQGEILGVLKMSGINKVDDANNITPGIFNSKFNNVKKVFDFAYENPILFHRALLTIGDYSTKISNTRDNIYSFYEINEQHHKNDLKGLIRPIKGDNESNRRLNIFNKYVELCCASKKIEEKSNELIDNYLKTIPPSNNELYLYYLVEQEELFKYCQNKYYILHKENPTTKLDEWYLMKTSRKDTFAEFKTYYLYNKFKSKGCKYNWDEKTKKLNLQYNGHYIEYKSCFVDESENKYNNTEITTIKEMEQIMNNM